MSDLGTVFQKGGGGTNFEQSIQTAFLTTMLVNGSPPCIPESKIIEAAFQTSRRGYKTDDFLVLAESSVGLHRLVIQVKHTISFTTGNKIFQDVLNDFWMDYNNADVFDKKRDKLLIIKGGLTNGERNHLKTLFNWALSRVDEVDFVAEVNRIDGKLQYLDTFRQMLKNANDGNSLSDRELWEFLKCIDVLEYDFLNQGSVDETYFLNLIRLCKHEGCTLGDKAVWGEIFHLASTLNKDGGSISAEQIREKTVSQHFDFSKISPYAKAVSKLKNDSREILRPIKNYLGTADEGFYISREQARQEIISSIGAHPLTIVTGMPGVGKSAEVKSIIEARYSLSSVFVFRADQFGQPTLSNVFSSQGINESITDIFSCISLIPEKILFIDSLEKLLEFDPECAFKQLMALVKKFPDIRIVATSRRFAIDLIVQKFGLDENDMAICDIPVLTASELQQVSQRFPNLNGLLSNSNINELLRSPKYLDFALTLLRKNGQDYSKVSLQDFRVNLWNYLVADVSHVKNGLPLKREAAFMRIAVRRAKDMALFVQLSDVDAEAVLSLERDGVVFQRNNDRYYSPAHDIFEDWALVRHVQEKYEFAKNANDLFASLGNEPAIRRAFRLWVEQLGDSPLVNLHKLLNECIVSSSIERYWSDEILIAIFKSSKAALLFNILGNELIEKNAALLKRCVLLIRTACKERYHYDKEDLLLPIGSGWEACIEFVAANIHSLSNDIIVVIVKYLSDWRNKFRYASKTVTKQEVTHVKDIVYGILCKVENDSERNLIEDSELRKLISILFELSLYAKDEIEELLKRAQTDGKSTPFYKRHYYDVVIEECLSGIRNYNLGRYLPRQVVEILWDQWKVKPKIIDDDESPFLSSGLNHREEAWGIDASYTHSSYPSGIYKTPVYNLLSFHPFLGLKFVVEFVNYSIEYYASTKNMSYKHSIGLYELEVNGARRKIYGCYELWSAFRGMSVTHYLLVSVLVSLEKYLLEIAQMKTDASRVILKSAVIYIINHTNNVAALSVLSSVVMAYPEEFGEEVLPLLSMRVFYEWDFSRAIGENSVVVFKDLHMPFASEESYKFSQLPHRKKYFCGLQSFVSDYLLRTGNLNEGLYTILDRFWAEAGDDDVLWRKNLAEMDVRKWRSSRQHADPNIVTIQPHYEPGVLDYIDDKSEELLEQSRSATYANLLKQEIKGEKKISFSDWEGIHSYYKGKKKFSDLFDLPITLAHIGLQQFKADLDDKQTAWCKDTLRRAILCVIKADSPNSFIEGINLMEQDTALQSIHLIYNDIPEENEDAIYLTLKLLTRFMHDHETKAICKYSRTVLFKEYPFEMHRVWLGLISHAKYLKDTFVRHEEEPARRNKALKKDAFLKGLSRVAPETNLAELTLETYEASELRTVFLLTPFEHNNRTYFDFFEHYIELVLSDLVHIETHSYNYHKHPRKIQESDLGAIKYHLAEIIFYSDEKHTSKLVEKILFLPTALNASHRMDDPFSFTAYTLEMVSLTYYDKFLNVGPDEFTGLRSRFWALWKTIYLSTKTNKRKDLYKVLFLNSDVLMLDYYGVANNNQFPYLEDGRALFEEMIADVEHRDKAKYMLDLYANIGSDTFLPNHISDLVKVFGVQTQIMTDVINLKLVKKLFYSHIMAIKSNQELLSSFLWILDEMIDQGYSEAYLFRENTITYKKAA